MSKTNHAMGSLTAHLTSAIASRRQHDLSQVVEPALLDARQGAQLLCVSLRKFHALRPHLPEPVTLGGRVVRWRTAELRSYVAALAAAATRPEPPQLAAARVSKQAVEEPSGGNKAEAGPSNPEREASRGPRKRAVPSNLHTAQA